MTRSKMALRLVCLAAAIACSVALPAQEPDARGTTPPASSLSEAPPAAPLVTSAPAPGPAASVTQLSPGAAAIARLTRQGLDESVIPAAPGPGYVWTPGHWQRSRAGWSWVGGILAASDATGALLGAGPLGTVGVATRLDSGPLAVGQEPGTVSERTVRGT